MKKRASGDNFARIDVALTKALGKEDFAILDDGDPQTGKTIRFFYHLLDQWR